MGLRNDFNVKHLVQARGEMFRRGIPAPLLQSWKKDMLAGKHLPSWIRDLPDPNLRKTKIESLTRDDVFRSQFRSDKDTNRSDIAIIDWGLQHIDRLRKAEIERKQLRTPLWVAFATAVLSLLITFPTAYFSSQLTLDNQIELNNTQKRHQLIGELMGRKAMMRQLYVSRFEARVYSDYYEARWKLTGASKDSFEFQEARRWMHKSEDLALEIAKSNQSLFETLGSIRSVFRRTAKLDDLENILYHFKSPQILGRPFEMKMDELETWKTKAIENLQTLVEQEYGKPIDELVDYLVAELRREPV